MSYHKSVVKVALSTFIHIETDSHPEDIDRASLTDIIENHLTSSMSSEKLKMSLQSYEIEDTEMFYGDDEPQYEVVVGFADGTWESQPVCVDLSYVPDGDLDAHVVETFRESETYENYPKSVSFVRVN
jgi:hypothetical protein